MVIDTQEVVLDAYAHPTWRFRWVQIIEWLGDPVPMQRYMLSHRKVYTDRIRAQFGEGIV